MDTTCDERKDNEILEHSIGRDLLETKGDSNLVPMSNAEPYIDMDFESEEAARIFYDTYASRLGFRIRIGRNRRSLRDGSNIARNFVCSKEGFRVKKDVSNHIARRNRATTRQGCLAMMMVKRQSSGKWVVKKFEKEHNHPLTISLSGVRKSTRQPVSMDEKDKKIRELNGELNRVKQRLQAFREHMITIYRDIEEHKQHISTRVQDIIREIDSGEQEHCLRRLTHVV